eukprot:scaffold33273_cov36-Cyclotella_meneghiniana.AAC.1
MAFGRRREAAVACCGGDLDQTQLGGVGPYHGLEGVMAGWLIHRWRERPSSSKREGVVVDFVFEFHFGKIIPAGRVKGCQKVSHRLQ